jgi:hypothetical protein
VSRGGRLRDVELDGERWQQTCTVEIRVTDVDLVTP